MTTLKKVFAFQKDVTKGCLWEKSGMVALFIRHLIVVAIMSQSILVYFFALIWSILVFWKIAENKWILQLNILHLFNFSVRHIRNFSSLEIEKSFGFFSRRGVVNYLYANQINCKAFFLKKLLVLKSSL